VPVQFDANTENKGETAWQPLVTILKVPVVAVTGTVTLIEVSEITVNWLHGILLRLMEAVPDPKLKPLPVTITCVPAGPDDGDTDVIRVFVQGGWQ
jgi:hypothetical protein